MRVNQSCATVRAGAHHGCAHGKAACVQSQSLIDAMRRHALFELLVDRPLLPFDPCGECGRKAVNSRKAVNRRRRQDFEGEVLTPRSRTAAS